MTLRDRMTSEMIRLCQLAGTRSRKPIIPEAVLIVATSVLRQTGRFPLMIIPTPFMTNMMPQAPNNNRYAWANLESYCRSMLSGGYEIYIISGGYGIGGDGSNGYAEYVANGMVEVPSNTWKVIMIIPDGDNDVSRVTASTRVIAVDMPNSQSVTSDWTQYKTTVDDIELMTGFDFFSEVPDAIEDALESQVDAV